MLRQADRTSPLPGTDTKIVHKRTPVALLGQIKHFLH